METPSLVALSRQAVLQREMGVIANNLANLNTTGFKNEAMLFAEYIENAGSQRPAALSRLSLVEDRATLRDYSEGPMTATGNPLDLAISGEGWFSIETERGLRYSRAGSFLLDAEGRIVTADGHPLLSVGERPLSVPATSSDIEVAPDGTVTARDGGDAEVELVIGRIKLVRFAEPQALKPEAAGRFIAAEEARPLPVESPRIRQGMLEGSNVKAVLEITKLIETMRSYQSTANVLDEEHERQRRAIQGLTARGAQA